MAVGARRVSHDETPDPGNAWPLIYLGDRTLAELQSAFAVMGGLRCVRCSTEIREPEDFRVAENATIVCIPCRVAELVLTAPEEER